MLRLYEILKTSKTKVAPDLWTRLAAEKMAGDSEKVRELTGELPLTFTANGKPLIDYTIYGNMAQSKECGEKTKNLLPYLNTTRTIRGITFTHNADGSLTLNGTATAQTLFPINVDAASTWPPPDDYYTFTLQPGTYTLNCKALDSTSAPDSLRMVALEDGTGTVYRGTFTITEKKTMYCYLHIHVNRKYDNVTIYPQLETGTAETAYEPYGYKIPISVNGQTNSIYIGSEPLRKAVDGSDAADTLNYSTQQLIRRVDSSGNTLAEPITENIELPELPSNNGTTVIDAETALTPSKMYIKYKE
jgi:hypothetical protein